MSQSLGLIGILQDIKKDGTSLINASIRLVSLTNDSQIFEKEDVALTALILENIVEGTNTLNEVSFKDLSSP